MEYVEGELTNDDLIELEVQQHFIEEEEERLEVQKFTIKGLANVEAKVNVAILELEAMDPQC